MSQVSIAGLDKAVVLKTLHDNSKAQGMSIVHERKVSLEECKKVIKSGQLSFDYFVGRVLKVDLEGKEFDPWGYDRDNGAGAAEKAISSIR